MSRLCSVCAHPDRAQVDLLLANSVALRVIGKKFDLEVSQLCRHRQKHIPEGVLDRLRKRGHRSDAELAKLRKVEGESLLDNLTWTRARLYANADRAVALGDDPGERAALAEAGRATDRIAKLLDEYGHGITINNNTINLVQMPQWHAIRMALVRELRPLGPAAIDAAARAIESAEASMMSPVLAEHGLVLEHDAHVADGA